MNLECLVIISINLCSRFTEAGVFIWWIVATFYGSGRSSWSISVSQKQNFAFLIIDTFFQTTFCFELFFRCCMNQYVIHPSNRLEVETRRVPMPNQKARVLWLVSKIEQHSEPLILVVISSRMLMSWNAVFYGEDKIVNVHFRYPIILKALSDSGIMNPTSFIKFNCI